MSINNMKAGYQGKKDSMREFADKLTKNAGHAPDIIYSKSCADKARMRIYKEGGMVKKDDEEKTLDQIKRERAMRGGQPLGSKLINKVKNDDREDDLKIIKRERAMGGGKPLGSKLSNFVSSNYHVEKMKKDISKEEERERREEREKMKEKKHTFKAEDEYKKGGSVKKCSKPKFAAGGVAKYRHDQMTLSGKQKGTKKDPYTNHY